MDTLDPPNLAQYMRHYRFLYDIHLRRIFGAE